MYNKNQERGLFLMKKMKDKIIITAAAGFTAISTFSASNAIPVYAKENTNTTIVNEDESVSKSEKERLEESLRMAEYNLDIANKNMEKIKKETDASKEAFDTISSEQSIQQAKVENQYTLTLNSVSPEYETLLQEVAKLESEITAKQSELDGYTKKEATAAKNLEQAKEDLSTKQSELDNINKELSKYDRTQLENNLKLATSKQNEAKDAYDSASSEYQKASTALGNANLRYENSKTALDNAQNTYDSTTSDVAVKQEAVNLAQKNVDSFLGNDAYNNAQKELEQADRKSVV